MCKMSTITPADISSAQKRIGEILRRVGFLATRCLFADPLIRGMPQEVFRRCGKATCKCMRDAKNRHGPYRVISVVRDGKQRQISLKKDDKESWDLASHYQHQMKCLGELRQLFKELVELTSSVIEKRIKEFPT